MAAIPPFATDKEYYTPGYLHRNGCPCQLTPSLRVSTLPEGERRPMTHEYTPIVLTHLSKKGEIKNSLSLDDIHHQLELDALALHGSGASNILLSKMSFDCLIIDESGKEHRDYHSFDLRIPGANTDKETVFSYDMIEKTYGSKKNLYDALKYFYSKGRSIANPANHTHGHCPDYDPLSSKHDQYIRHTEQLLVAYLALPQGANMLFNRLKTELRAKYPNAISVKLSNIGLHMRSTKTCCAPCEYSLIGLMNEFNGVQQNGIQLGLLPNFKLACSEPNENLIFTVPKRSAFRLLVTVTASEADAHHKKQPAYTIKKLGIQDPVPPYIISVKSQSVSQSIFTTMLNSGYDQRKIPSSSSLSYITVGISGSKATAGSPGTIYKVQQVITKDMTQLEDRLSFLRVTDDLHL